MDALTKAIARSNGVAAQAQTRAEQLKQAGIDLAPSGGAGLGLGAFANRGNEQRYSLYRGWAYSAIHAKSSEAASQPVFVGRLEGGTPNPEAHHAPGREKRPLLRHKVPAWLRHKATRQGLEIDVDHPLVDILEQPNDIQRRWQFVYSFCANLDLTGWSFIVRDEDEEGRLLLYSLPTTWVRGVHKDGKTFTHFAVGNPKKMPNVAAAENLLPREMVAFAHLPNPANPLGALAPATSQIAAFRIDDHIQTSQEMFFERGIFPSVIVTVGTDPHPDISGGKIRQRLTAEQRREVYGAIRKSMAGIYNYGEPAIIDGMIDKIERWSATQNEMGWEKSEESARRRILSAFGVHPYILGEPVNVGGYAQAAKIEERFCKRINIYLHMLGDLMTTFAGPLFEPDERTVVWWEDCQASDPALESSNLREARKLNDITKNEHRVSLGLPPIDEEDETRAKLLDVPAAMNGTAQILAAVGRGDITRDNAAWILSQFFQIPIEAVQEGIGGGETQALNEATGELRHAIELLKLAPPQIAEAIVGH